MISKESLISIVTVSYNSEKTISETMDSVLSQTYKNIEHVFIDGGSSDSTCKLISEYTTKYEQRGFKTKFISEKDDGLYDAMNKGVKLATGEVVFILNSDDLFYNNLVVEKVYDCFYEKSVSCVYGDIYYFNKNENIPVRIWIAKTGKFNFGWNPPHPSTVFLKDVYNEYGYFRTGMKISADYDFLFRVLHRKKVSKYYLNEFFVKMRLGGESTRDFRSNIQGNKEIFKVLKENREPFKILIIFMRLMRKATQKLFLGNKRGKSL